jgi:hypothetical protein
MGWIIRRNQLLEAKLLKIYLFNLFILNYNSLAMNSVGKLSLASSVKIWKLLAVSN